MEQSQFWFNGRQYHVFAGQGPDSCRRGTSGAHQASSTARRVRSSESGMRCPYVDSTRPAFFDLHRRLLARPEGFKAYATVRTICAAPPASLGRRHGSAVCMHAGGPDASFTVMKTDGQADT